MCKKKLSRVVFPYDFWHKKNYSVTSFNTLRRVLKQLLSDFWWMPSALDRIEATFFWPTNKDSNQIKPSKPIGFVIWVKTLQDEMHIRLRYLISNFEQLLFWALVWLASEMEVRFFLKWKKFSIEWCSHKTFDKNKILYSYP